MEHNEKRFLFTSRSSSSKDEQFKLKGELDMKKRLFAMLLVLALFVAENALPVALATTDYNPCDAGDHVYELREIVPGGYGGRRYFTVSSCQYSSQSHTHYYITYSNLYIYDCRYCGYTKTVEAQYDDTEQGVFCMLHDVGR